MLRLRAPYGAAVSPVIANSGAVVALNATRQQGTRHGQMYEAEPPVHVGNGAQTMTAFGKWADEFERRLLGRVAAMRCKESCRRLFVRSQHDLVTARGNAVRDAVELDCLYKSLDIARFEHADDLLVGNPAFPERHLPGGVAMAVREMVRLQYSNYPCKYLVSLNILESSILNTPDSTPMGSNQVDWTPI
jgi:hypothetical protein